MNERFKYVLKQFISVAEEALKEDEVSRIFLFTFLQLVSTAWLLDDKLKKN